MPIIATRASAAYGAGFGAVTTVPYAGPYGAYDALATVTVGASSVSSIVFAGIPTGYKHLEIRGITRDNRATTGQDLGTIRFNGDAGTNYARHRLYGSGGGSPSSDGGSGQNAMFGFIGVHANNTAGFFGTGVFTILDYADTTKYKTLRGLTGDDQNGTGYIFLMSGLWMSTSAINSITLIPDSSSTGYVQYSSFALYGVK
jgi:hypothetical protein